MSGKAVCFAKDESGSLYGRSSAPIYTYVSIAVTFLLVGVASGYLVAPIIQTSSLSTPIRVGENIGYGIYAGANKVGTLTLWVDNIETFDGVPTYTARYSIVLTSAAQAGLLRIDNNGILRHARIVQAVGDGIQWSSEIYYSYIGGVMRVIYEDNRVPENYAQVDNSAVMGVNVEIAVPIHVWYMLRTTTLTTDYQKTFVTNILPEGTNAVISSFVVAGEETVSTAALGSFSTWKVQGTSTFSNMWVTKDGSRIVKVEEQVGDATYTYVLESYS